MVYLYSFILGLLVNKVKLKNKNINFIFFSIIFSLIALFVAVNVITGEGFNRSFIYHVKNDLLSGSYAPYFYIFLIEIFALMSLFFLGFFVSKFFYKKNFFKIRNINLILIISLFVFNPSFVSLIKQTINLTDLSRDTETEFNTQFKKETSFGANFNNRDIIFITGESLERSFFTNKKIDFLNLELINREDVIDFSKIEEIENYTDWSIAGIVASNCGLPLLDTTFYFGFKCLSDLFDEKKYYQEVIQGSSFNFAGNGNFYKSHKLNNLVEKKMILRFLEKNGSENYNTQSSWGFYDDIVFDYSISRVKDLENSKKNYALWINTLDNHPPNGFLSDKCKKISKNIREQLLKTAFCTDFYINNFINETIINDKDKNNLFIVTSDHLLMESQVSKKFFKNEKRKNLFLIIDPYKIKKKILNKTPGNQFDIPATIINYLSDEERIGIGYSLLKKNNKSLSNNGKNIQQTLNNFSKNLKKIIYQKNLLDSILVPEKNLIKFKDNFEMKIPLLMIEKKFYQTSSDIDGTPRMTFDEIVFKEIIRNNKKLNFEGISNCNQIKLFIEKYKVSCNFTYIKLQENNDIIIIELIPYKFKKDLYILSLLEKKIFTIEKNTLLTTFKKLNEDESFFSEAFRNLKIYSKNIIKDNFPNIFNRILKIYLGTKDSFNRINVKINYKTTIKKDSFSKKDIMIAHAGGSINEKLYTNSIEALDQSYMRGVKYFELDLKMTSDNKVVAVHDWENWKKRTEFDGKIPPTLDEFMSNKIDNKYTPMSYKEIIEWFLEREDTFLVTDKLNEPIMLRNIFKDLKNKLIIELFTQESIEEALNIDLKNILVSQRLLWKNNYNEKYLQVLMQSKSNVRGFAVNKDSVYENPKFFKKARDKGFKVYVYGINDFESNDLDRSKNEQKILCDLHSLIDGIYADFIIEDLEDLRQSCK